MPITEKELPEVLTFIGIDDVKDVADFKTRFAEKWHTADTFFESDKFKDHVGKWNGELLTKIKSTFKSFGLEITDKDIKGKKPFEVVEQFATQMQENFNTTLTAEKEKVKGSKDDNYKALESKYQTKERDFLTLEEANKKLKSDWEADKNNFASQLKNEKLSFRTKDLFGNFKWSKDASDLVKKGFMASIAEKAKFDLDENDNLIVLDAKTGQKFPNPKQHSSFLSAEEYLTAQGVEAKVYQSNPDGGKPAGQGAANGGWGANRQNGNAGGNNGNEPAKPTRALASNTY